jgi:polyhydroxyalkanoate synthase
LSNSGHLQSLLNPPTNPKASFVVGPAKAPNGEAFVSAGEKRNGSWWPHWRDWLFERSGAEILAPASLGSNRHPPGAAAPGTYVFD